MIRRKCVSLISAFPQGGRWIKGKHGFFIIKTGGSEQAEIPRPARKKLCLRARSDVQLMHYVYVLRSVRDGGFYIGYSANLRKRFEQHEKGASLATSYRGPWKLIYYEAYLNQTDALGRERYLKSGAGRRFLKAQLRNYLADGDASR